MKPLKVLTMLCLMAMFATPVLANQFEYKVFVVYFGDSRNTTCPTLAANAVCWQKAATKQLQQIGDDGWEIISVQGVGDSAAYVWARRPKSGQ